MPIVLQAQCDGGELLGNFLDRCTRDRNAVEANQHRIEKAALKQLSAHSDQTLLQVRRQRLAGILQLLGKSPSLSSEVGVNDVIPRFRSSSSGQSSTRIRPAPVRSSSTPSISYPTQRPNPRSSFGPIDPTRENFLI